MRVSWCVGLLPLLVAAVPAHGDDSWRLDSRVAPTSQTINLTLDPAREGYEGRVQIDLEVREPVASFRLNSEGPALPDWRMTGSQGKVEASLTDDGKGFLTVSVGEPLPPGDYTLEIAFTQEFNPKGEAIYRTRSGGGLYIFSHFQYIYARRSFPCWDEPGFKIPYRLRMRVPAGLIAVSNTPIESESTAEGWREIRFAETRPLPTYLLACAVGPFDAVPIEGLAIPGSVYTVRGRAHLARSAVEVAPPILDALADYFGSPYPYAKLDLLAVPEFLWGGDGKRWRGDLS
jgi:alanyl aminopeptidase